MMTETAVLLRGTHLHDVLAFGRVADERFVDESEDGEAAGEFACADGKSTSGAVGANMLFRCFNMGLCKRRR